jgi:hypothetical protein
MENNTSIRTKTEILIKALQILSDEIDSEDGVANAAILEASQRLEELNQKNQKMCGALELIVEDCEAWLKSENQEPSVEFIKLVIKYAKETLESIKK